jgi:sugar phosphate isomerase/epimerase
MKIGIAEYGFYVWEGANFDPEVRWRRLKEIGYEGIERLEAVSADDALRKASMLKSLEMDFTTLRTNSAELNIKWTAALGKSYVWTEGSAKTFQDFCRQVNMQSTACRKFGIDVALHNHMGSLVETQEQLEDFLQKCPECKLILDTGHLAAMSGDCVQIIQKYSDRLVMVHVKDWIYEKEAENWWERGHFCELGSGNIGLDNAAVISALKNVGYDGWVCVELDTPDNDLIEELIRSREYLRQAGVWDLFVVREKDLYVCI